MKSNEQIWKILLKVGATNGYAMGLCENGRHDKLRPFLPHHLSAVARSSRAGLAVEVLDWRVLVYCSDRLDGGWRMLRLQLLQNLLAGRGRSEWSLGYLGLGHRGDRKDREVFIKGDLRDKHFHLR